jgi:hypothetical protein
MMVVIAMVINKCSDLEKKKEKTKLAQGKGDIHRAILFW